MIPKKGTLKFMRDEGWVIFTSVDTFLKVHKNTILEFGLKKNNHYYKAFYHFNMYGDLCIWLDEHSFSLDKSVDYDIKFKPVIKD